MRYLLNVLYQKTMLCRFTTCMNHLIVWSALLPITTVLHSGHLVSLQQLAQTSGGIE